MLLVVPGLFAGRGRAIMFTLATEVLIAGPLGSIEINLERLINTGLCLYKEAKSIACLTKHTLEQTKHVSIGIFIRERMKHLQFLFFTHHNIELLLKLKSSIEIARIIAASAERELQ